MKKGFIFDIDGVIADTPHEVAWGESLEILFRERRNWKKILPNTSYSPGLFTTELYRSQISGKSRIEGARSILNYFHIEDSNCQLLREYCAFKQQVFMEKIDRGEFKVYEDGILLMLEAKRRRYLVMAASSSKNANIILSKIDISEIVKRKGWQYHFIVRDSSLLNLFDANICGIHVDKGKPNPEIFIRAAEAVNLQPEECCVVEDSISGVLAAIRGNFFCIGVARHGDEEELIKSGAHIVTNDLYSITRKIFL